MRVGVLTLSHLHEGGFHIAGQPQDGRLVYRSTYGDCVIDVWLGIDTVMVINREGYDYGFSCGFGARGTVSGHYVRFSDTPEFGYIEDWGVEEGTP